MKTRKMKSLALSAACLAIALAVAACSNDKANTENQTTSPSSSDSVATSPATPGSSSSAADDANVKQAEGEYTGMIDGHSIEIIFDGEATAFQIDMDTADKVSEWEMGTRVKFQYSAKNMDVNGKQIQVLTIEAIDKA